MAQEYRLVATPTRNRRPKRWPKRNLERATRALLGFVKDQERSPYWDGATVHIEVRDVSEWRQLGIFDVEVET